MISEMAAVEILGPVEVFHESVETIQDAGALHIVETPLAEFGKAGLLEKMHLTENQAEERESCVRTAEILDEIIADIPARHRQAEDGGDRKEYERLRPLSLDALSALSRTLAARARSFTRRDGNISADIDALAAYETVLAGFAPLVETRELPKDFEMVGVVFERRNRLARDALQREIERITSGSFRFLEQQLSGGRLAVLVGFPAGAPRGSARSWQAPASAPWYFLPASGTSRSRRRTPHSRRRRAASRRSVGGSARRWIDSSPRTRRR